MKYKLIIAGVAIEITEDQYKFFVSGNMEAYLSLDQSTIYVMAWLNPNAGKVPLRFDPDEMRYLLLDEALTDMNTGETVAEII